MLDRNTASLDFLILTRPYTNAAIVYQSIRRARGVWRARSLRHRRWSHRGRCLSRGGRGDGLCSG
jgi:hypothetical protein